MSVSVAIIDKDTKKEVEIVFRAVAVCLPRRSIGIAN